MNREEFEALPEIARIVSCDEIKWCDVYNWYRTDNTDANSIYHVAWLNGAWFAFCEQEKRIEKISDQIDSLISESELWGFDSDQASRQLEIIQELLK